MLPTVTAKVHIKRFLRANSNSMYQQKEDGKGQNKRPFSHSELESILRRTATDLSQQNYFLSELGQRGGWMDPQKSAKLKVACWISQN